MLDPDLDFDPDLFTFDVEHDLFFFPTFFFLHRVIWDLSDMDKDGMLDLEEFTVAMHLCDKTKAGEELPDVLPRDMIPPSKVSLVL